MIVLILTILLTSSFFITFRYFPVFKVNTFHAIVINYSVCVITGLTYTNGWVNLTKINLELHWVQIALFTGLLFLSTFFLMSQAVIKVSVTAAGIANKTALVIPMCVSLVFFSVEAKEFSIWNYIGMLSAVIAIVLASIKKNEITRNANADRVNYLLPVLVFLGGGAVDSFINYSNYKYSNQPDFELYPIIAFASASATGWVIITVKQEIKSITLPSIIGGFALGIPNYFSLILLLQTLKHYNNNGAIVFPVLNTGIIILTTLLALVLFKEKLSILNYLGLILAIIAIVFIFI